MKVGDPNWPAPSSAAASRVMQGNRGRDTAPEVAVRSLLHRRGLRFRTRHTIKLTGRRWTRPDIVFLRPRVAVYVDGCFWHTCPDHGTDPTSNASYWTPKLARNVTRDADTNQQLASLGWYVVRVWEHEDPGFVAARIALAVEKRGDAKAPGRCRPADRRE